MRVPQPRVLGQRAGCRLGRRGCDDVQDTIRQACFLHQRDQTVRSTASDSPAQAHRASGSNRRGDPSVAIARGEIPGSNKQARPHRLLRDQQPGLPVRRDRIHQRPHGVLREPAQLIQRRTLPRPGIPPAACPSQESSEGRNLPCAVTSSNARRRIHPRSRGAVAVHASCAATATSNSAAASSAPASAIDKRT